MQPAVDSAQSLGPGGDDTARHAEWTPWCVLAALLIANLPLFICMPLTDDAILYDLQAQGVLDGGCLYRDILEPNLPGVVWVHMAVRSLAGGSSEALRSFDLVVFGGIVLLLMLVLRRSGASVRVAAWTGVLGTAFYFSVSEWNHCQRDTWMLLPGLAAFLMRLRQVRRLSLQAAGRVPLFFWAFAEGVCWAAGFWIKPFIVVPAIAVCLAGATQTRRFRIVVIDLSGLLAGGLATGGLGILWLVESGAWPWFLQTVLEWNPGYFAAGKEHWTGLRFLSMGCRFFPWILLHLAAVPLAVAYLFGSLLRRASKRRHMVRALLSAFYLGWLVQAAFLQHLFDYVHAPGILLGIAVLALPFTASHPGRLWRPAVFAFVLLAAVSSPLLRTERLGCWPRCFSEGSTARVRDSLALLPNVNYRELERVVDYLRRMDAEDGDVVCFYNHLTPIHSELRIAPATRFVFLESILAYFPERSRQIREALAESGHRYVVTDLSRSGLAAAADAFRRWHATDAKGLYPWGHPVVFRAGPYLVHRVDVPLGRIALRIRERPASGGQQEAARRETDKRRVPRVSRR